MLVIGHRGASAHALENTLEAFRLCVENPEFRCDGVELDIHSSADGELVVHHDPTLADGRAIAQLPAEALSGVRLPDGSPLPTLAQALEVLAPLEVFIEAKGLSMAGQERLLTLMRSHPAPARLHVHAFDHRIIRRLHEADASLSLGVLSSSYPLDVASPVLMAGARTLWQEWHLIDRAMVERCSSVGIRVIAWTVNSTEAAAALREMGVAGVCGNWPERLVVSRES
jgi:glycerophosphoryl diester phosphodiesterase